MPRKAKTGKAKSKSDLRPILPATKQLTLKDCVQGPKKRAVEGKENTQDSMNPFGNYHPGPKRVHLQQPAHPITQGFNFLPQVMSMPAIDPHGAQPTQLYFFPPGSAPSIPSYQAPMLPEYLGQPSTSSGHFSGHQPKLAQHHAHSQTHGLALGHVHGHAHPQHHLQRSESLRAPPHPDHSYAGPSSSAVPRSISVQESQGLKPIGYDRNPSIDSIKLELGLRPSVDRVPPFPMEEVVETPEGLVLNPKFRSIPEQTASMRYRQSALPLLDWADCDDVWALMCWKDDTYKRDADILRHHEHLTAKHRAVVIEWIMEVCQEYQMHRETFHLAVDYMDRYLAGSRGVPPGSIQLVGVTALFIAAKLEEIYPPKLAQFAYVTDGACSEDQIQNHELIMLKTLNWSLYPVTVNSWLKCFLQSVSDHGSSSFEMPHFKAEFLKTIGPLIDLCVLDIDSLRFPASALAASAFYLSLQPEEVTLPATGYKKEQLQECIVWMESAVLALKEHEIPPTPRFRNIPDEDLHNIQLATVQMSLLNRMKDIRARRQSMLKRTHKTPVLASPRIPDCFLTPPDSSEKPPARLRTPAPEKMDENESPAVFFSIG